MKAPASESAGPFCRSHAIARVARIGISIAVPGASLARWGLRRAAEAPPSIRIDSVVGRNAGHSFTTHAGEDTVRLYAAVTSAPSGATVRWTMVDNPAVRGQSLANAVAGAAATATALLPAQDSTARYVQPQRMLHGAPHPLSYRVRAELVVGGAVVAIDSVPATQSARDALRQEYLDWRIPVPPDADIRNTATYAGIPGFSLAEVNWGDHGWIVIKDTLATMLPLVRSRFTPIMQLRGLAFEVTSMFRNPVHNNLHTPAISRAGAHPYGVGADLNVPSRYDRLWRELRRAAKLEFFACVEPRHISPTHIHVDWPPFPGRPHCHGRW